MNKAPCPPCSNAESFCLMWYGTGAGRVRIWNSRNGVTPFYIDDDRKHEDWRLDQFSPWHRPLPGDLVFVDLTLEAAAQYRRAYVDKWWDAGELDMAERYASKDEAVRLLASADVEQVGTPDMITVRDEEHGAALSLSAREAAYALGLRYQPRRFA